MHHIKARPRAQWRRPDGRLVPASPEATPGRPPRRPESAAGRARRRGGPPRRGGCADVRGRGGAVRAADGASHPAPRDRRTERQLGREHVLARGVRGGGHGSQSGHTSTRDTLCLPRFVSPFPLGVFAATVCVRVWFCPGTAESSRSPLAARHRHRHTDPTPARDRLRMRWFWMLRADS